MTSNSQLFILIIKPLYSFKHIKKQYYNGKNTMLPNAFVTRPSTEAAICVNARDSVKLVHELAEFV